MNDHDEANGTRAQGTVPGVVPNPEPSPPHRHPDYHHSPWWRPWTEYPPAAEENYRLWNANDKTAYDAHLSHANRGWQSHDDFNRQNFFQGLRGRDQLSFERQRQLQQEQFDAQRQRQMYDFNDIRTKDLLLNAHLTDVNQLLKHREDVHGSLMRAQAYADAALGKDLVNATLLSQAKHNAQQMGEYAGMLQVLYGVPLHSIDAGLSKQFLTGVVALGMQELVGGSQERVKGFEEAQRLVPTQNPQGPVQDNGNDEE